MPDQDNNTEYDSDEVQPRDEAMVMSRWQRRLRQKQAAATKAAGMAAKAKTIRKWVKIAQLLWPLAPFILVALAAVGIVIFIIIGYYYMQQQGTLPWSLQGLL